MYRLLATALMAMAAFVSAQALELTVFDGEIKNTYVPIDIKHYDYNGHSQVIFPKSALAEMVGSEINSIKFYLDRTINVTKDGLVRISMGVTDQDRFNFSEYISSEMTVLTNYSVPNGVSELVITFDQPFMYNGGNLVFDSEQVTAGSQITGNFYGIASGYDSSFSYHSFYQFLPKTTFDYTPLEKNKGVVTPQELDFGNVIKGNEVTLAITLKNVGTNAFTPSFGAISSPFSFNAQPVELAPGQSMEILVTFNPVSSGTFAGRLIIDCGGDGTILVPLTASCLPWTDVVEGTDKDNYIPIDLSFFDWVQSDFSQVIYPASMLTALNGKKLNSLKFYTDGSLALLSGGKVKLSLKEVDITGFADVNQVSDMSVVADATPAFDGNEMQLTFDTPFEYHGGNLAVEVALTEPGNTAVARAFLGKNVDELVSFYYFGESSDPYYSKAHFLPKATFGFVDDSDVFEKGDVDHDNNINIADVTALIDYLLRDVSAAPAEADVNGDHSIDISDVTSLIDYLLSGNWPAEEMVYTVVGPECVFGSNWNPTDEANDMVKGEDGTYTWTKRAVALDGNFKFKIVGNHDWNIYEWPIGPNDWVKHVAEPGIYDITITFNPEAEDADRITCTLTETPHVYTVAGTYNVFDSDWEPADERNDMVKGEDGIYTWSKDGVYLQAGDVVEFKVVRDHAWDYAWPSNNWHYEVAEAGVYGFVIKFNPEADDANKVSFYATKLI